MPATVWVWSIPGKQGAAGAGRPLPPPPASVEEGVVKRLDQGASWGRKALSSASTLTSTLTQLDPTGVLSRKCLSYNEDDVRLHA